MPMQVDKRAIGLWHWRYDESYLGLVLDDGSGNVLAWVSQRAAYCDRGHYFVNIEIQCELDEADKFPRYYMKLQTAMDETKSFLEWRLFKIRSESFYVYRDIVRKLKREQQDG